MHLSNGVLNRNEIYQKALSIFHIPYAPTVLIILDCIPPFFLYFADISNFGEISMYKSTERHKQNFEKPIYINY